MNTLMKKTNGNAPANFSGLVDNVFRHNLNRILDDDFWGLSGLTRHSQTPVNIEDTGTTYEIHLVAPGFSKENFKVQVNNNMLTIAAEQQEQQEQVSHNESWIHREYQHSAFTRSFTLDDTTDANAITAQYKDGILHLSVPKKEEARSLNRTISVE